MTDTETDPRTFAEIAREVADDIEQFGHYRFFPLYDPRYGNTQFGAVCVITAPAFPMADSAWVPWTLAFLEHIGVEPEYDEDDRLLIRPLTNWNDNNDTATVLAALRSMP